MILQLGTTQTSYFHLEGLGHLLALIQSQWEGGWGRGEASEVGLPRYLFGAQEQPGLVFRTLGTSGVGEELWVGTLSPLGPWDSSALWPGSQPAQASSGQQPVLLEPVATAVARGQLMQLVPAQQVSYLLRIQDRAPS